MKEADSNDWLGVGSIFFEMETEDIITEIEAWVNNQITTIDKIEDEYFKMILYFSLIDSFAQEKANYKKNDSKTAFISFVSNYCESIDFLGLVDPVTLYYDCIDDVNGIIDIHNYLTYCRVYKPGDDNVKKFRSDLLDVLNTKSDDKKRIIEKHRYVELLYSLRSKLVHEMGAPGLVSRDENFNKWTHGVEYHSWSRFLYEDIARYDDVWALVIPTSVIRTILNETVSNYLNECRQNNIEPFNNNVATRKYILSWYD